MRWTGGNAWQSDGRFLFLEEMEDDFEDEFGYYDFLGRRPPGDEEGSRFQHFSDKFGIMASGVLPHWWASKFQEATEPRAFHSDLLAGCEFHHYHNRSCYQFSIGRIVEIFASTEHYCYQHLAKKKPVAQHKAERHEALWQENCECSPGSK